MEHFDAEWALPFHARVLSVAQVIARAVAALSLVLAGAALLDGLLHAHLLQTVVPGQSAAMQPRTALALVALAGLLLLTVLKRPDRVSRRIAWPAVTVASLLALLGSGAYVTGIDTHLAGRMAPNTALGLLLAGAALLAVRSGGSRALLLGQILALATLMLGQARLDGLAYHVRQLGQIGDAPAMDVSTGLALVMLGLGTFLLRPDEGLAALLTNSATTGHLGRWMVGVTLVLIPVLGWVQLTGQDRGWYGARLGVALLAYARTCALLVAGFAALALARRVENAGARAERKVGEYAQLQAFMDHTPAVIFTRDLNGRYLAANSRFEHVVGAVRDRVAGARVEDLLPPEAAAAARTADLVVLANRAAVQHEEVIHQQDGPHHYLTTLFPLIDGAGEPYAVCGVALDVTDRVLARSEAERLQRRFRDLLEAAPDATVIADGAGAVVMVNAQAENLLGHRREDLIGRPLALLLPEPPFPQDPAHFDCYRVRLETPPEGAESDPRARHRDGHEFPVELSISPLETEDGLLVSVAIRDITERRRIEAEHQALYEQQRHIALTLQHSLMGTPPQLSHLPTSSRYLASAQEAGVGGDWFDLIPLDAGRIGILIGDVMGRGVDAAAVMGQLRAAAHALAQTGMSPARLMTALDDFVSELPDQLVTCCYLIVDPAAAQVTVCSAGHPPTLLAVPRQPTRPLPSPISVPLGVGGFPHQQAVQSLPPGATLALYTDGLVETPDSDIDSRIQILADTLEAALADRVVDAQVLDQTADLLLKTLIPDAEAHDDDVTLLLVRVPAAPESSAAVELSAGPRSASAGRRFVAATLSPWNCPADTVQTACLLASELLTNAIRHAQGPLGLQVRRAAAELSVEVTDRSPTVPSERSAGQEDENGRGLALVTALADRWGTRPHADGKTVWFTLALKPA
ncbi:PAS domain S-box-containing protein [Streptacidiphilus sp. MAP12-16]|uniref:SpoIIE family protein phosphatase n=1 Tax=Streptacidiphilus sp. MAP12-16 TaxID=3156300 RepID=UPI003518292E